jgi:hypothetical protein
MVLETGKRKNMRIVHIGFSPVTDGWNYQDNLLPKYHTKLGHKVWYITGQWVFIEAPIIKKPNL